ncbi:MAG: CheR family methyltransferase [Ignavibacteria bacterium]|jgi:chemotaxis protein methyltransferase CheR
MKIQEIENIEISLLLEAIYGRYGYDFRDYARATVERRSRLFAKNTGLKSISELIPRIMRDEIFFERLVKEFSITVTELFRDPSSYKELKLKVFPILKTYPFIKIWHAGCATGEEVYSLAILLKQEGLYDKATIYATDFNDEALEVAKNGIYSIDNMKQCTANYLAAGGTDALSDYYYAKHESVIFDKALRKNVMFANHNLTTDGIFGEMHLVMCKNVLIYFNKTLQNKVLNLFCDSLIHSGYLCLGSKESILFTDVENKFENIDKGERIFRKITGTANV